MDEAERKAATQKAKKRVSIQSGRAINPRGKSDDVNP
jgi:hypothetical protein